MYEVLKLEKVSKRYNNFYLNNINLSLPSGCIMGLIGENGAGKTTIIKLILKLINKDSGKIEIFGKDNIVYEEQIKKDIGIFLDECSFHECLDANSISTIMNSIYPNWSNTKYFQYLKSFSLPTKQKIGTFSKGMKAKLIIAVTLSSNPKLLILDEPTTGLDPVVRNQILEIYKNYAKEENCSVLFSSHITTDIEKIADYVTFIHKGEIILSETKKNLFDEYYKITINMKEFIKMEPKDFISYITENDTVIILLKKETYLKKYNNFKIMNLTFEDIFLLLIKNQKR